MDKNRQSEKRNVRSIKKHIHSVGCTWIEAKENEASILKKEMSFFPFFIQGRKVHIGYR